MKSNNEEQLDMIFSLIETLLSDKKIEIEEEIPFDGTDICPYDGDCDDCPYEKECTEDLADCSGDCDHCDMFLDDMVEYDGFDMWGIPDIDHVVFSEPATIVFWCDGTKTVVKCMKGEKYERYAGFMAACMKKMFGSTSRAKAIMNENTVEQVKSEKKKAKEPVDMSHKIKIDDDTYYANDISECVQEAINEALTK